MGGERDDDPSEYGEDNYDQPVGTGIVDRGSFAVEDPGPTPWQDFITQFNPNDLVPIAGNTEPGKPVPRDPTSFAPRQEPTTPLAPAAQTASAPQFELPQGVAVDEGMFSGLGGGDNSMGTPAVSREPFLSSQTPIAADNPPEGGTSRGPMRRSQQSPSLFAQSNSPNLSGRAGGLMGGGLGSVGADSSGPIKPTEMFQKLLEMFKQG